MLDRFPARGLACLTSVAAVSGFVATVWLWSRGGGAVDLPWAPSLDVRLHFRLDGLAALYVLIATGIGAAVFVYSLRYLPLHLEHQRRSAREQPRFYAFLLLFMVSMVGLATAQDLVLLFVFWDLTAVASYFLVAYDRQEAESRWAALMALLVTGITGMFLLIAALLLYAELGTFSLPELFARSRPSAAMTTSAVLIAVAAVAKSAQVPFHFWLPRAMVAPIPVSAYLHSAAMVAAGVLLIGRAYPLLEQSALVLDGMVAVGFASMLVGGFLALTRENLKQILAYSTFAQYGYVVFMYGLGTVTGVVGAGLYVLAHALAKSALFLTAGAVMEASDGVQRLSEVGGLARRMPVLAAASAVAAATVAALPLTIGFFADELFFKAALERGWPFAAMAVAGAALTVAYLARFWGGIYLGPLRPQSWKPLPWQLVAPIVVLGLLVLVGGVMVGPFEGLAEAAGESSVGAPAVGGAAYHLDARTENLMALASYGLGALVLVSGAASRRMPRALAGIGARVGPERWYVEGLAFLNALSDRVHQLEVRDLRGRVAAVLLPAGLLVIAAVVGTPSSGVYEVGRLTGEDVPLVLVLAFAMLVALAATVPREHLTLFLILSALGFSLAVVYAFFGGPDVALVAVLVETLFALLFLGVFSLVPSEVLRREASLPTRGSRRWRDPLVGIVSGAVAFALVLGTLSASAPGGGAGAQQIRLAPEAHAKDVVTAVLADFRALDTLVEVSVLAVALAGVVSLLRRGRMW